MPDGVHDAEVSGACGPGEGVLARPSSPGLLTRILVNHNPFYAISAVLVLFGLRRLFGAGISSGDSHVLLGVLAGYTILTAGTSVAVVRWGHVWEDARSLLLILLVFLGAAAVALDDMVLNQPETGARLVWAGALASVVILELVLKGSRIRLRATYRVPFYVLSTFLYTYPLVLLRWLPNEALQPLYNGLALFPFGCALLLLAFLPAARAGRAGMKENGTPWPFPAFPWLAVVGLAIVAAGRSYYLTLSFFPIHGDASPFGVFWLIPLVYSIAALLLALGLEGRHRVLLRAAMLLPLATIPMACFGASGGVGRAYVLELSSWLATPFELNALLFLAFAACMLWVRAPGGRYLIAVGLGMALFGRLGDVQSAVPLSNSLAVVGTAALPLWLAREYFRRRGSWRLALAGAVPIITLWVRLDGTAFTDHHAAIPVHLLLAVIWVAGLVERDRFAGVLRAVASLATFLLAGAVVLIANQALPFDLPVPVALIYAAAVLVLTVVGAVLKRCPYVFVSAGGQALVLGGRLAWSGSGCLRMANLPKGTGVVVVGVLLFGVGAVISAVKGALRRNNSHIRRALEGVRGFGPAISKASGVFVRSVLVLVITVVVFGFLAPCCNSVGHRHTAYRINCSGNLKQIGLAMRMYSGDHDEVFPPDFGPLVEGDYLTTLKVYQCPTVQRQRSRRERKKRTENVTRATLRSDYVYFAGLTEDGGEGGATKTPLACDRVGNHTKYGHVLFADGHVKGFAGAEWWKQAGIAEPPIGEDGEKR